MSDVGFGALHKEGVNYSAARGLNNSNQVPGVGGMVNPQLSRKVSIESESECAEGPLAKLPSQHLMMMCAFCAHLADCAPQHCRMTTVCAG